MALFKNVIEWYQAKIGDHDKQGWEQTVEGKIQRTIDNLPKRDFNHTEQNRELLDIDLIKGSTFTKAAPSHTSYVRTWEGFVRILFLPVFYDWWLKHTTWRFFIASLLLYAAQVFVTAAYFFTSFTSTTTASLFEVANPLIFMFVLSVMHTQIVYTQSSPKTHIYDKASAANAVPVSMKGKRNVASKRMKKSSSKNIPKRKPKTTTLSDNIKNGISMSVGCKRTTDSSEGLDDISSPHPRSEHVDSDDEGSVCSIVGKEACKVGWKIDTVPDVAADTLEKHSPKMHRPSDVSPPKPLKLQRNGCLGESAVGESEGTSDPDSPTKVPCTSDTEWENSRVCNSEVADSSTDSSSEFVSDNQPDDDLGNDGPISLKKQRSHSLAYVPSFYDRITCVIWEKGQCKKVDLSVVELGGQIERQVANLDYDASELLFCTVTFTLLISLFPFLFRLYYSPQLQRILAAFLLEGQLPDLAVMKKCFVILLGSTWQELVIIVNGVMQRFVLTAIFCFLVSVAEKSYWQRLQYAKFFSYLTSARRSHKHGVPHFRLNKVKNIKIWLSLRAYLKKRGPQRSVEVIVGSVFGLMVAFLAAMCVQLLSDMESFIRLYANWELTLCCLTLTCYLLRFYSLGTKITKKYRNLSTIITEQINLFLHMEQKPHKKEELLVANSVLKLAESLIKEIESPYKMSTSIVNPVVFNVTRVAMLSAFSAVISELLGFKLKLHKVKIN